MSLGSSPADQSPAAAGAPARETDVVRGERTTAIVDAPRGVQSRMSSMLAAVVMIALGVSGLGFYYAKALTRGSHARQVAQSSVASRAQGDMPLPSLGRIDPPVVGSVPSEDPALSVVRLRTPAPPTETAPSPLAPGTAASNLPEYAVPPEGPDTAPRRRATGAGQRRLSGAVLARGPDSQPAETALEQGNASASSPVTPSLSPSRSADSRRPGEESTDPLATLLRAPTVGTVQAQLLPTRRFLLPQGSFIDCTLETAIESTLPGMTTCVTASDTFGADGKVVLLERGTKLVGETRGQVQQGQARVFVLWTEARTPTGVVVPLASPGTDELGRAGLPGEIQRHFWERFGAAMLVSLIDGALQAGIQASARPGGTVVYASPASQDVLTEVLRSTVSIPPTITKHNGDRIEVLVARDLDFRSVYELRAAPGGH